MKIYLDHEPPIFLKFSNAWRYNYNIELMSNADMIGWSCDSVEIYAPFTSNDILRAVIHDKWDTDRELKFINDYNSVNLGIYTGEKANKCIQAYTDYLTIRELLKEQIESDLNNFNSND